MSVGGAIFFNTVKNQIYIYTLHLLQKQESAYNCEQEIQNSIWRIKIDDHQELFSELHSSL